MLILLALLVLALTIGISLIYFQIRTIRMLERIAAAIIAEAAEDPYVVAAPDGRAVPASVARLHQDLGSTANVPPGTTGRGFTVISTPRRGPTSAA